MTAPSDTDHENGFAWLLGYAEDALYVDRNRALAEEVDALANLIGRHPAPVEKAHQPVKLSLSLTRTKKTLYKKLEESRIPQITNYTIRWGSAYPEPPSQPTPADAQSKRVPFESQRFEDVGSPGITAVIDLCDWLQRSRGDDRIRPERVIEVAEEKAGKLLAALRIERIDRKGLFNEIDQQIADFIATESVAANMQIAETLQCGYRIGDAIIRPQKVLVFRYRDISRTEESNL
jgi:hypothetical protein